MTIERKVALGLVLIAAILVANCFGAFYFGYKYGYSQGLQNAPQPAPVVTGISVTSFTDFGLAHGNVSSFINTPFYHYGMNVQYIAPVNYENCNDSYILHNSTNALYPGVTLSSHEIIVLNETTYWNVTHYSDGSTSQGTIFCSVQPYGILYGEYVK